MVQIVDCPQCSCGKLKIDTASGYKIITDGYLSKLPLNKKCRVCGRDIKYLVVHESDYERMLKFVQTK